MIAPRTKMIYAAALIALPLAFIMSFYPESSKLCLAVFAVAVLLFALDAVMAIGRLDNISASFEELVRLSKNREGEVGITIENMARKPLIINLGILLPRQIISEHETLTTRLLTDSDHTIVKWPVTPLLRGNYGLDNIYLETGSPAGLWATRKAAPSKCEVRVYPDTRKEQKNLAALFLNRGLLGIHTQRQVGKGREFEKLREYQPGDGLEDIHWKATAKRGFPVTKVYQIERTQELYVVIDSSRLSSRLVTETSNGPGNEDRAAVTTQLERFITSAMVLGLVSEKQGDLFGVISFDDQVRKFVRARNGQTHYGVCRDALYTLEPRMVNPDFGEVCSFIRTRLRKRSLIIFLTNLDDPVMAESFVKNLDVIGRHHLVLVNMITTPGMAPVFSLPNVETIEDIYKNLGGHIQWRELRELTKVLKLHGVTMSLLQNERMCPELVSQYINVKRRQLI